MLLSERAKKIIDVGMGAFRKTRVRPDPGHTELRQGINGYRRKFSVACVVGAMAHEARVLMGMDSFRSDEASVAAYFDVEIEEVRMIEGGFDSYFHVVNGSYDFSDDEDATMILSDFDLCNCEECIEIRGERTPNEIVDMQKLFTEKVLPQKDEFWQVGWAIAKKATEHYKELDKSEDEAWKMYEERGFADKDWFDIQLEEYRAMFKEEIDALLALPTV